MVIVRLGTLVLAQVLDLTTFVLMIREAGPAAEANPLAAQILGTLGMPAMVLAKVAVIVLVGALAVAAWRREQRVWAFAGGLPLAIAIAVGLIGGITNTAVVIR